MLHIDEFNANMNGNYKLKTKRSIHRQHVLSPTYRYMMISQMDFGGKREIVYFFK